MHNRLLQGAQGQMYKHAKAQNARSLIPIILAAAQSKISATAVLKGDPVLRRFIRIEVPGVRPVKR